MISKDIQEKIDKIFLVGKYMEIDLCQLEASVCIGNGQGNVDWSHPTKWYSPDSDWNDLMPVCKKIIESYFDKRTEIFAGLHEVDIEKTFNAVVDFIIFWNDDTIPKMTWTTSDKTSS